MLREVVLQKVESKYCARIPEWGIAEWADDAETAYLKANSAADQLSQHPSWRLSARIWGKVALIILVISLVLLTAALSIERSVTSLRQNFFDPNPTKVEKNRQNFRLFLEKHKPLIEEWQQATEKK